MMMMVHGLENCFAFSDFPLFTQALVNADSIEDFSEYPEGC